MGRRTLLGVVSSRSANLNDPTVSLTSSNLASIFGGLESSAGVAVTEQSAYGLTAYYRGVAIMASTIAGLPLKTYHRGTREAVTQRTVLDSPNPRHDTPFKFWQTMVANGVSWGRMTAMKKRNGADIVNELWPVHPSRVRPTEVDRTDANPAGLLFLVTDKNGTETRHTSHDVLHIPYLSPDGVTGLSPLTVARESIGTGLAAERSAGRFFKNGSQLAGILRTKTDLTQAQAEQLQTRWADRTAGPDHAGKVTVLDNDAEFSSISIPPKDAELLASRKWTVTEIARLIGIPPHMLGDIENSTSWGTGIEQQMIGFGRFTLKPWLDLIEQTVTAEVLPGGTTAGRWFSEYTLEGLLRGDAKTRAAFYASAIQMGWLSRNEVRSLENREPVDGLEEFLAPSNMTLVQLDGSFVPMTETGQTDEENTP